MGSSGAVSAAMRRALTDSIGGLAETPLGPLATKASAALSRMLADVGGSAELLCNAHGTAGGVSIRVVVDRDVGHEEAA